ncbi:MAG: phosphohistidine phosphatase SixA [Cyclobacteriaceae bacterium]
MAKHLYLFRHAEAAGKESRQEDRNRELSQAGVKDSLHMGAWFQDQNIKFDAIISSSAMRAEQTAMLAVEAMKLEKSKIILEDVLYEASLKVFLDYLNNIEDAYQHVLCVGHNPVISYLAEYLTKAEMGEMVAGSVAIIKFEFPTWKKVSENTGELVQYVTPEMVARY